MRCIEWDWMNSEAPKGHLDPAELAEAFQRLYRRNYFGLTS